MQPYNNRRPATAPARPCVHTCRQPTNRAQSTHTHIADAHWILDYVCCVYAYTAEGGLDFADIMIQDLSLSTARAWQLSRWPGQPGIHTHGAHGRLIDAAEQASVLEFSLRVCARCLVYSPYGIPNSSLLIFLQRSLQQHRGLEHTGSLASERYLLRWVVQCPFQRLTHIRVCPCGSLAVRMYLRIT